MPGSVVPRGMVRGRGTVPWLLVSPSERDTKSEKTLLFMGRDGAKRVWRCGFWYDRRSKWLFIDTDGAKILGQAEEDEDRDFFLTPDASRQATQRIVVEHADAMAMPKALLNQLKRVRIPDGSSINNTHSGDFGKVTCLARLQSIWCNLGRWSGGLHQDSLGSGSHDAECDRAALQRLTPSRAKTSANRHCPSSRR